MARIAGVDIPNNKKVEVGLTNIFGVGRATAREILAAINVDLAKRIGDLSETDISAIRNYIEDNLKVEGDLRKEVALNIKRLMEINCYRGQRHKMHLPCRGQSTRSNGRTRKGIAGKRGIKKK